MYQGFFINLDRNEVRRRALSEHLDKIGAASRYRRVQAVDGRAVAHQYQTQLDPGRLGCWLSHKKILEANHGAKTHLHIIEDDTILAQNAMSLFDELLEFVDAEISDWDLFFTDIYVVPGDGKTYKVFYRKILESCQTNAVGLFDLQNVGFSATSSYFVNRQSIEKYAKLIASPGIDGLPIDLYIRSLVIKNVLKAFVTVPFLTSVSRDSLQSDISGEIDRSRAVIDIFRRSFFQDADLPSLDAEMQEFVNGLVPSLLDKIYLNALLFTLSDRYVDS